METNKLKKFATEARNRLKNGIAAKIITLGFDKNGNVPEHMHPQLMQGGSLWNGRLETKGFFHQWQALNKRVQQKGLKEVYEEAAYTWFNRLVAIRILQKNGLIEPVLAYVDEARTPRIVDEARMGRMPQMPESQRQRLMELLDDDSKTTEQFAILVTAFCHENPILFRCFGAMSDYTELLLPNDILTEGGFVDMLNHTEFITDDDFRSPELIGWLYQFYISERKDEVFAKKGKFEADEIPAATQIFTPNWIVKYMVQNTIGRIYLDNNPSAASEFKPKWQYLVEPSTPTPKEAIYNYKELTDLLVGDLACGSGHILNECFDLLYDLYIYEGYSRREAVEYIFTHNLRGIDLDTRAKQLATFALMLKACQKDSSFADAHILPKVLNMPTPIPQEQVSDRLKEFFRETPSNQIHEDLTVAFELMQDADSLGSIMKFDLADSTQLAIRQTMNFWQSQEFVPETVKDTMPAIELILTLTDKYAALVMNPPYMGAGHMEENMLSYVKSNYSLTSNDLGAIFMDVAFEHLKVNGKMGMINQAAWFFKPTYKDYRFFVIENEQYNLDNALYLGPNTFPELKGEVVQSVTFVSSKSVKRSTPFFHLKYGETSEIKRINFGERKCQLFIQNLEDFLQYGGYQFGFWINTDIQKTFKESPISKYGDAKQGLKTGDNTYFIKLWFEISHSKWNKKWFPVETGGNFRKWYGNGITVLNWENDGYEIKNFKNEQGKLRSRPQGLQYSFKNGITWSTSASDRPSFRISGDEYLFESSGSKFFLFNERTSLLPFIAYFNSYVVRSFIEMLSPGLGISEGSIKALPYINPDDNIEKLAKDNVETAKLDWDAHETSWDFEENPLVHISKQGLGGIGMAIDDKLFPVEYYDLPLIVEEFKAYWEEKFEDLHANEEELNRQFIEIYGLQDELSPEVLLEEITILQQGEISVVNNGLEWHEDVLMKQLISYAVGVWMGRYRLDRKGLHIAHPNPTEEDLQPYLYAGETVRIDDDGLIPVLPQSSPFDDNLSSRIADFIRIAFGAERLTENLNYIEQKLGTSIDQYVQKDFWKDHKKMYQNRPIYWLFSSSKGAFKCLAYMHRMNAYTVERVRTNYLLPYIEFLQNQVGELENRRATLSTAENRKLQNFQKALDECREYHERLQVVAEQAIAFDLDDGVVVNYAKFGDVLGKIK